jgi:dephospho-CoA kinase
MIRIGILGDIGSGKSFIAKSFGYPVFNADYEVNKLYNSDKKVFKKLQKILPKYFYEFPIDKKKVTEAILAKERNLKKIVKIVHLEIRKKMSIFLIKNKGKKIVILDIPLLLENKINKKKDILIFIQPKKIEALKRLKKRKNYNKKILNKFRNIQLPVSFKKKKSQFIIVNNFKKKTVINSVKNILKEIL